ncbi:MAG: ClpXP protease specificity-enhancing factor [Rhodocyclales bacterium]|nr:ClpXP protease specificity-enhancing factor [Rhodocyclales bacterium]
MQSTKPYLIRAIHEWCADQGFTPYLSVKVDAATRVPREFVKDGEIVLNVGVEATHQLMMGNEEISFQARFGGKAFPVVVPVGQVMAIYARENGDGMAFDVSESKAVDTTAGDSMPQAAEDAASTPAVSATERPPGKPFLTRIK